MENENSVNPSDNGQERGVLVVIMLVLSTMSAFFGLISNAVFYWVSSGASGIPEEEIREQMSKSLGMFGIPADEQNQDRIAVMLEYAPVISSVGMLSALISAVGIGMMIYRRKVGFHLYTAARLLEIGVPLGVAGGLFFSPLTLFSSIIFILVYYRHQRSFSR